ncbi:hypothetical protein PN462_09480 [Spirulina sp. CS-785/01]|uniref:hypothetical protein n=1 Tax=Spirulina sp. CS-785/01 TaxID=3021716 RepID=UPI00232D1F31|nr:hypothetical protein [Spirulina sp. CS-785/01]MDB9313329.1 hypothetical protein [Spirulina sp. CS-785/01]
MSNISIEELEAKIAAGEEIVDQYFDPATTRVGQPHSAISRRRAEMVTTELELPAIMLTELDGIANALNISREAVIKMILRRSLDEHYLAKQKL